jgi:hypothetical protein
MVVAPTGWKKTLAGSERMLTGLKKTLAGLEKVTDSTQRY